MSAAAELTPERRAEIIADQQRLNRESSAKHAEEIRNGDSPPIILTRLHDVAARIDSRAASRARILAPVEINTFLEMRITRPDPMLGNVMSPATLLMIYGLAGTGKTYFNLAIAVCVSHGLSFLNWAVPTPRSVLYIDGELPAYMLQQRIRELRDPIEPLITQTPRPMHIITPDLQPDGIPKIDTEEGRLALLQIASGMEDLSLVILDNLSCLTNPEDDNSSASWSAVQELLLAFRRMGIAVIVVHHAGKGGQQRGTSRRADILDVILKLSPEAGGHEDGRTRIQVEFEKGRSLPADAKAPFTATLEPGPTTGLIWTRGAAALPVATRARQMLLDGMPAGEVASEIGAARSYVYRLRNELIASGELSSGRSARGQT